MYKPARVGLIFAILAVMLTIYVSALYRIQIYETQQIDEAPRPQRILRRDITLPAARGNIYDRNGVLLASGRPSYNIKLDWHAMRAAPHMNENIQELIYAAMDKGIRYTDTFPVTRGAPFEFITDMTRSQRSRLDAYLEYHKLDPNISVSDLLAWMRFHYKIDYTVGILDARLIIGVRYELEIRMIIMTLNPYIFTNDVPSDFVSYLEERGYAGVFAESIYIREYHTAHAAHLLGYIGPMTSDEYAFYKELGYPMDARIGKVGAEGAFEQRLRGINGSQTIRFTANGTIVDIIINSEPIPGDHVYLTIDLNLQIAVEHALRAQIEAINLVRIENEEETITGGAVVVTNVNTGEILASASYPSFNLSTLSQDWTLLNTDPTWPMLNRATQGWYSPGSTFKMVTAFAGLRHGTISRYTPIYDPGRFTRYIDVDGFAPFCWVYPQTGRGHDTIDVVQAIECSCNFFFMQVGDWLEGGGESSANAMAAVAQEFGLGRRTGLELPENPGRLATPEVKEALGDQEDNRWFRADTVTTAFGQNINRFTPVQLANYSATIANGGTLYSLSILRRVMSYDFDTIYEHTPEILNQIEETNYVTILQEGMRQVSRGRRGTAASVFRDYPIVVASKTGTVQLETSRINDGVFVCYAPAGNPEIAISIVVEKGGSGSAIMDIARMIFDHYFIKESTFQATPDGELIP